MSEGKDPASAEHPVPGQSAGEQLSAADAERLITRHWAHPEAQPEQHVLAALFDSATGPATEPELTGEVAAVAAFVLATSDRVARAVRSRRGGGRRAWAVVTAGVVAASVAGFSGAAAADALPGPVQELAHQTFDAPAPKHPGPVSTPAPAPGGPAAGHGRGGAKTGLAKGKGKGGAAHGSGNGNGNGKAKGHGKANGNGKANGQGNGNGNGNGKSNGNGNGKSNGNDKGKGNGGTPPGQQKKSASATLTDQVESSSPGHLKLTIARLSAGYAAISFYPSSGHRHSGLLASFPPLTFYWP